MLIAYPNAFPSPTGYERRIQFLIRDGYQRKLAEGKTKKEALRALKRRISDAVWRQLQLDLTARA